MTCRRIWWLFVVTLVALTGTGLVADVQAYPDKPITVVVPWPPGSGTGLTAQHLVNAINQKKYLSQPLQVVHRPGGTGTIGTAEVLAARPDGYTVLYNASAPIIVQPLVKDLPYNHRSLIPVVQTVGFPWLIAVRDEAPWRTMQELLEHAKQHPGELIVGTAGDYTWGHVALLQVQKSTGLKFRHIPFEGSAPNVTALLGGHTHASLVTSGDVAKHVAANKVRLLATVERERAAAFPDIPMLGEFGIEVSGTLHTNLVAVAKGTPGEIVEALHDAFKKAIESDDYQAFIKQLGGTPSYGGYEELPAVLDTAVKRTADMLEDMGVKVRRPQ
jgi:tripartite-type tricarboxylate transporter receptor subunit TctC